MRTEGIPKAELGPDLTTIGAIRKSPLVLYGIFVEITRQIYAAEFQPPDGWLWNKDTNLTKIWIDSEYKWEDVAPNFRPAIFISLSPIKYISYTGNDRGLQGMNLKEAEYDYARSGQCSVSWVHMCNTKGEAVMMASLTHDYLDAFSDVIRKEFCFRKFHVTDFIPPQPVKEDREKFRCTVTAFLEWTDAWTLKLESPKLKEIVFQAGQEVMDMLGSA